MENKSEEPKVPTLDSLAAEKKLEPWKLAAIKAKHKVPGNRELDETRFQQLVDDIESITIGGPPPAKPEGEAK